MCKKYVVMLAVLFVMLLSACGKKEEKKSGSADATPTAMESRPSETPSPTATPAPTEEPTPGVALPDGFPEAASLKVTPKYTAEEITKLMKEDAEKTDAYVYHEITDYKKAQTLFDQYDGVNFKDYSYDRREFLYKTPQNPEDPNYSFPDAEIYYLNGEIAYAKYRSVYGTYCSSGYSDIQYNEKDADGKTVLRFYEYYFEQYAYDENGKQCLYERFTPDGELSIVEATSYDENGRISESIQFTKSEGAMLWEENEHYTYTYDENGNCIHRKIRKPYNETSTGYEEDYTYKTYDDGRLSSVLVKRSGQFGIWALNRVDEEQYFYMEDGSVLMVRRMVGEQVSYYANQFYPTKKQTEYLLAGHNPYTVEDDEESAVTVRIGIVEKVADNGDASDYAFPEEDLIWEDNIYQNGLLVYYRNRGYSGMEVFYKYDSAGHCIHKYGWEGYEGDFDSRYTYDSAGNLIREENKGTSRSTASAPFPLYEGEEFSVDAKVVSVYQYQYDSDGNRISLDEKVTVNGAQIGTVKKTFDTEGCLVTLEVKSLRESDAWESVGERIR